MGFCPTKMGFFRILTHYVALKNCIVLRSYSKVGDDKKNSMKSTALVRSLVRPIQNWEFVSNENIEKIQRSSNDFGCRNKVWV